ncbi:MAG: cation efflux system protein [bacterium]|nr:cation efflux system protein [bacterium]
MSDAGERICHGFAAAPSTETKERRVRIVVAVTLAMMVGELVVGLASGSLALVAEAWHMGSHAGAIGLTAIAYWFARTRANHASFAFGTGKVHGLAGFTNGIILIAIAVVTIAEACKRFFEPVKVDLREALPVAVVGLAVNAVCALLLQHDHGDDEEHDHHHDHNLRAAYLHVLGDVVVSLGAMVALVGIRLLGWTILDPMMAVVSSCVILKWGVGLCRTTARQLLDLSAPARHITEIRARLEAIGGARIVDLHVWQVAPGRTACVVSLLTSVRRPLAEFQTAVREAGPVAHLTVEVADAPS